VSLTGYAESIHLPDEAKEARRIGKLIELLSALSALL